MESPAIILALVLVLGHMVFAGGSSAPDGDTSNRSTREDDQYSLLQRRLDGLDTRLSRMECLFDEKAMALCDMKKTRPDVTIAQRDVTTTQRDVTTTQRDVTTTQRDVTTTQRDVTNTQPDVTTTQQDVTEHPPTTECYFDNWPLNMAHNKTTYASSSDSHTSRTVDGNRAEYNEKCMNTGVQTNPWLVVDLNETMPVSTVVMTAFTGQTATSQYKILVGDTFDPETFNPLTSGYEPCPPGAVQMSELEVLHVHCQKTLVGRYVLIFTQQVSTNLRLCEVEVYKEQVFQPEKWTCIRPELQEPKGRLNIAQGLKAKQSTSHPEGKASKAVDGNDNPDWRKWPCAHTMELMTPHAWWRVDLRQKSLITGVAITNRMDCCSFRLRNFTILVGNTEVAGFNESDYEVCAHMCETHPYGRKYYTCNTPLQGNRVAIALGGGTDNVLTLCEVEVYSDNLNDVTFPSNSDLGEVTIPVQQRLYDDNDMTCLTGGQVFPTADTTPRYIHIHWDPTSRTGIADRTSYYDCKQNFYVNTTHTADMNTAVVIHDLAGRYQKDCPVLGETDRLGRVQSRYACSCAQKCGVVIVVRYPGATRLADSRLCTVNVYD